MDLINILTKYQKVLKQRVDDISVGLASGGISNTASATSYVYVDGDPVVHAIDQSDDGDDTDGNTVDDPTIVLLE